MTKIPFKFLDSYNKEDSRIFFGRDNEIEEIYSRLFLDNMMLIYGPSGTGKTSILQCGVANRFSDSDWKPIFIRRKGDIIEAIDQELKKNAITPFKKDVSLSKKLYSVYLDYLTPIYIVFDQFEELFIFGNQEEKQELVDFINEVNNNSDLNTHIIISIREEYLANLSEFEETIPRLFNNRIRVKKMNRNQALKVIMEPCKVCDVSIDEEIANRVLDVLSDDSGNIELTWLQVLMDSLYKKAYNRNSEDVVIAKEDIEGIGRIGDILGTFLEDQLKQMDNGKDGEIVLKSFISSDSTKKQCSIEELEESMKQTGHVFDRKALQEILQYFIQVRILNDKDDKQRYELRHDSLAVKIFERLTLFEKEFLEVRHFLEYSIKNYQSRDKLLNEEDLKFILPYEDNLILDDDLKRFIALSKNKINAVKRRKRLYAIATVILLLIIMALFTTWALIEQQKAYEQTRIVEKNKKEIDSTNVILGIAIKEADSAKRAAMISENEAINAKEIVEKQLYDNIKNSLSISPLKFNVFYKEIDNPVSITASGIDAHYIKPGIYGFTKTISGDSILAPNAAKIFRKDNIYYIRDIDPKVFSIYIEATGVTSNGDTLYLGKKLFRTLSFPGPFVAIGDSKGGNISRDDILKANGIKTYTYSPYIIPFKINSFDMNIVDLEGNQKKTHSNSEFFSEDQIKIIKEADAGAVLKIDNIDIEGPGTLNEISNTPISYIIDGEIYDSEQEENLKINQIINLAKEYTNQALYSYRVLEEAYSINPENTSLIKAMVDIFYQIQDEQNRNLRVKYGSEIFMNNYGAICISDAYNNTFENGVYKYSSNSIEPLYTTENEILDFEYSENSKYYAILEKTNSFGRNLVLIDNSGKVIKTIIPINDEVKSFYLSKGGNYIFCSSITKGGVEGKRDLRAILIDSKTGDQKTLWGLEKFNTTKEASEKNGIAEMCIDEKLSKMSVIFQATNGVVIFDLNGNRINFIPINGPLRSEIISDDNILVKYNNSRKDALSKYTIIDPSSLALNPQYDYDEFNFTTDSRHIVFTNSYNTIITNNNLEELYEIAFPDMQVWGNTYYLNKDYLFVCIKERGQYMFSLSNNIADIVDIVDKKKMFGDIPVLTDETQAKILFILNY